MEAVIRVLVRVQIQIQILVLARVQLRMIQKMITVDVWRDGVYADFKNPWSFIIEITLKKNLTTPI